MSGGVSYYTVTVPEFVRPGDTFPAMVNGELIQVRCPMNAGPNVKLNIKVVSPPIMYAQYTSTSPPSDSVSNFNRVWIFMDLVLLVLFILSISLTKFAIQRVNSACNVLNPNNGNQLNQLYYHLYSGLGSTETCSVTGSNFW